MFKFQESPKYLLYRGRDDKAADVLQNIAKFNRQTCDVTADTFQSVGLGEGASENSGAPMLGGGAKQLKATYSQKLMLEFERYKILFAGVAMTRLTILIWLTYICDYWGFTVAGECDVVSRAHAPYSRGLEGSLLTRGNSRLLSPHNTRSEEQLGL